jgi:hypothetical protein
LTDWQVRGGEQGAAGAGAGEGQAHPVSRAQDTTTHPGNTNQRSGFDLDQVHSDRDTIPICTYLYTVFGSAWTKIRIRIWLIYNKFLVSHSTSKANLSFFN